jgi:hypothetical protein
MIFEKYFDYYFAYFTKLTEKSNASFTPVCLNMRNNSYFNMLIPGMPFAKYNYHEIKDIFTHYFFNIHGKHQKRI